MIPLTQTAPGREYVVCKIKGKLADRLELEADGILPGTTIKHITIVDSFVVCRIRGRRLSITRESARNIFVVEADV